MQIAAHQDTINERLAASIERIETTLVHVESTQAHMETILARLLRHEDNGRSGHAGLTSEKYLLEKD